MLVYRDVPLTLTTETNYLQIWSEQIENVTLEIDAGDDTGEPCCSVCY